MRNLTKIFALILTVSILVCSTTFAAVLVEGTNGETITLSFAFCEDKWGEATITEVEAEDTFYITVNFDGNPTEGEGINAYDILVGYDPAKMSIQGTTKYGATEPTKLEPAYTSGVAYAAWASEDGVLNDDDEVMSSGVLFIIKAAAIVNLTQSDFDELTFVTNAESASTKQKLQLVTATYKTFTIAVPDPEPEKPTISGSANETGISVKVTSSEDLNTYDTLGSGLTVYVGVYNSNHELVDAKFGDYLRNGNDFLVDITDASYYKAFVWDEDLTPVVDEIEFYKDV